jgi:hypothetical protein
MFHKVGHFLDLDDFLAIMPHADAAQEHLIYRSVNKRLPCVMAVKT